MEDTSNPSTLAAQVRDLREEVAGLTHRVAALEERSIERQAEASSILAPGPWQDTAAGTADAASPAGRGPAMPPPARPAHEERSERAAYGAATQSVPGPDRLQRPYVLQQYEAPAARPSEKPPTDHMPPQPYHPLASFDWEHLLGRNWFAIAGALALVIGVGFFLRLAFENQWIGTTERVLLGLAGGLALLGIGQWAHSRYRLWAQAVTGGGVAVLYLSGYAAFGFYQLVGPVAALMMLSGVVVVSGLLALRRDSQAIALLGITGAFLTPALLGRDLPSPVLFLSYLVLVNIAILGIAIFRNWRWLTFFGLAGSYVLFTTWVTGVPDGSRVLAQAGLTAVFLLFVGSTTIFHILWRREPEALDLALMTANAAAYYGLTFGLLWAQYEGWFGLLSLGLAAMYGLVAYAARLRAAPGNVTLFAIAMALVFLTIAVPLQLGGPWITLGWLAEGAALVWLGGRAGDWRLRTAGLGALIIGTVHLLLFDTPVDFATYTPLLNVRFGVFAFAIAAWYLGGYLYGRGHAQLRYEERYNVQGLVLTANALTVLLLSIEAAAFFESRGRAGQIGFVQAHHYAYFALTAIWTAYAAGLAGVGMTRGLPALRVAAIALLSVAVAKLLLFDITLVRPEQFQPLLNGRFLLFAFAVAALLGVAYLYHRNPTSREHWERHAVAVAGMAGAGLALVALSAEAIAYFDSLRQAGTEQAKQLTLTLLWGTYAVGLIAVGILRRLTPVRLAGSGLLVVTMLKLFGFDVFLLEHGYRVAAFVTLGVLLLATGLAYQRYGPVVKDFLLGKT